MFDVDLEVEKSRIETPALLVDLDAMERNIRKMMQYISGVKAKLRPHAKTHKCPIIAHKQVEAGATGVCCQKLGEAEVMVASGIKSIMITNEVVSPEKIERLVSLQRHSDVIVALDNLDVARATSEAALRRKVKQGAVIEVDVGVNRCGVNPGRETLDFAKEVMNLKGISFRGLLGYEGPFSDIQEFSKRREAAHGRLRLLVETADMLRDSGIDVEIVSAGATGTYNITGEYPGITEIQPGSYVFMETRYSALENVDFEQSLTLLTTVMSKPKPDRIILDGGLKTITQEFGMPKVKGLEESRVIRISEEHIIVEVRREAKDLKVGDKVELIPSHCCTTVNLHDKYYGVRDGVLEVVWEIPGRGKSR
ncbi:MAG: DSD1 family PLP-dependent enzyme [Candidatus Bathyarchaeia archaeon]